MSSKIEWTDETWNPVIGCRRVSEGCRNCYAERIAARLASNPMAPSYDGLASFTDAGPRWSGEAVCLPEKLAEPLSWRKPRRVFVNSMSDLFHEDVSFEFIAAVFGVMAACPDHTFQVLTKRPERMFEFFEWLERSDIEKKTGFGLSELSRCSQEALRRTDAAVWPNDEEFRKKHGKLEWPLSNVWLGVSVENQDAADKRIPLLLECPAAVRFLSCEPLLGPVDLKGWGDSSPSTSSIEKSPDLWADFEWPEWVPDEERRHIEQFWSEKYGRGPKKWARDHVVQQVPRTGATVTVKVDSHGWANVSKMATDGVTGRYLHMWNNIGSIITADGEIIPASGGVGSGWLSHYLNDDGRYRSRLHWVIAGGESGPGARPMHPDWVRDLRDQCEGADVPFFFKQWGAHVEVKRGEHDLWLTPDGDGMDWRCSSSYVRDGWAPMALVGKKKAGNEIDGRTHQEFPEVTS